MDAGQLDGERPALVPPGIYRLGFIEHETKIIFSKPKLFVWFRVLDYGEHFGARIPRYYGIRRVIGKACKGGRFAVGWKSDFLREYARIFPAPQRLDRFPMTAFKHVIITGKVRTVCKGHEQQEIPKSLQYSVIAELIAVEEGQRTEESSPSPVPSPSPLPPPT